MQYIVTFFIGIIGQMVDVTIGMGYGVTVATLLTRLGYSAVIVSASLHASEIGTSFASGSVHLALGNIDWKIARRLLSSGILGAILGAVMSSSVSSSLIRPYVSLLLLLMGIVIVIRFGFKLRIRIFPWQQSNMHTLVLGFFAAFIDAVGGGGWGPIATPGLLLSKNDHPKKVIGTVNLTEFVITVVQTITFFLLKGKEIFPLSIVIPLLVAGVLISPVAAVITQKLDHQRLGVLIGVFLIITNVSMLFS